MKSEFEIIGLLERYEKADDGISINDLANIYRIDVARSLVDESLEQGYLVEKTIKWYYGQMPWINRDAIKYCLSEDGRDYLRTKQKAREQKTDNDAKLAHDKLKSTENGIEKVFITAIVGSTVTFILAHIADIIAFIKGLFMR